MGAPYSGVDTTENGYRGKSNVSFHHALILAADAAHQEHPGEPATVTFEIILGSNPPINEYRVTVTPGG